MPPFCYFSATGATEARRMAPYERLGLWGVGAPFADFPAFLVAMERGGVAAMAMLCRDLKSVGTYLSRTISYGPTRREDARERRGQAAWSLGRGRPGGVQ